MRWKLGTRAFEWRAPSTRIAGILNVTPDSFSDGGRFVDLDRALSHAEAMVAAGAELIDIGGESSRPGADPVSLEEEVERVVPVVRALRRRCDVAISVDTVKPRVAALALEAGAEVINDITALADPAMRDLVASSEAGVILMHMRGTPKTMQQGDLGSVDLLGDILLHLEARMEGLDPERVCLDPGIGFGKTVAQNAQILRGIPRLSALGRPLMIGASRKSFIGAICDRAVGERRDGTTASSALAAHLGAHWLRVHDVGATRDAVRLAAALEAAG